MLKHFFLLLFTGCVILAAMLTFSPKVARASGGPPELASVSAISASDVWAAGASTTSSNTVAVIEHWDGHSWQISSSATPTGALASGLSGITAISQNNVWAVGSIATTADGSSQPLTEHWNGVTWQFIPNAVLPASGNLAGVAAVSAHNIWAVGSSNNGTLIEHWDGSSWSVVLSPNPGANGNLLEGVAAISARDIWAAGSSFDSNFAELPLIEHWDGSSWSVVSIPTPGSFTRLTGVTAFSSHDAWVVGSFFDNMDTEQALVEHWNGSSWQAITGLNPVGSPGSFLQGVAAVSHKDVWAIGSTNPPGGGTLQTLIEHWNGSSWQIVSSPNFPGYSELESVAAVPYDEDVWTVGRALNQISSFVTLTEAWDGARWSIVPSPNP